MALVRDDLVTPQGQQSNAMNSYRAYIQNIIRHIEHVKSTLLIELEDLKKEQDNLRREFANHLSESRGKILELKRKKDALRRILKDLKDQKDIYSKEQILANRTDKIGQDAKKILPITEKLNSYLNSIKANESRVLPYERKIMTLFTEIERIEKKEQADLDAQIKLNNTIISMLNEMDTEAKAVEAEALRGLIDMRRLRSLKNKVATIRSKYGPKAEFDKSMNEIIIKKTEMERTLQKLTDWISKIDFNVKRVIEAAQEASNAEVKEISTEKADAASNKKTGSPVLSQKDWAANLPKVK